MHMLNFNMMILFPLRYMNGFVEIIILAVNHLQVRKEAIEVTVLIYN